MHFIDNAPLYKIVRITGPQHNMLVIQLTDVPMESGPVIEKLGDNADSSEKLRECDVMEQVMLGFEEALRDVGGTFFIVKIQYVPSDSHPVTIYRELAGEIVRRVQAKRKVQSPS